MKQHLQTLIQLLSNNDLKALLAHYMASTEPENIVQLTFIFQQAQKNPSAFEFYQQLATTFIDSKGLPSALIGKINNSDGLNFFIPALQLNDHFGQTNQQQRNVLHYLLAGNQSVATPTLSPTRSLIQPPFNYLRSMMLFESNETLHDALCQRDCHNFTPVEIYLLANQNLTALPDHEFTALLGLIEIESKKHSVDNTNYLPILNSVAKLCLSQGVVVNNECQRLLLIATYYQKSIKLVVNQIG
jgi:hypothetical protein